jgi:Sulfatase
MVMIDTAAANAMSAAPHGPARLHLPRRYVFVCAALCFVALAPQVRLQSLLGEVGGRYSSSSRAMFAMSLGGGESSIAAANDVIPADLAADFQWDLMAATDMEEEHNKGDEGAAPAPAKARPNLLFILVDQMRWDTLGFVQRQLPDYAGKLTIRTPNLDRLAERGINFDAYCATTPCVPSRGSLKTGCTVRRTGISGNSMDSPEYYTKMKMFQDRIERLRTFEQVLVEELGYRAEFYGKHHIPDTMLYGFKNKSAPLYANTYYDFEKDEFSFRLEQNSVKQYKAYVPSFSVCLAVSFPLLRDACLTRPVPGPFASVQGAPVPARKGQRDPSRDGERDEEELVLGVRVHPRPAGLGRRGREALDQENGPRHARTHAHSHRRAGTDRGQGAGSAHRRRERSALRAVGAQPGAPRAPHFDRQVHGPVLQGAEQAVHYAQLQRHDGQVRVQGRRGALFHWAGEGLRLERPGPALGAHRCVERDLHSVRFVMVNGRCYTLTQLLLQRSTMEWWKR